MSDTKKRMSFLLVDDVPVNLKVIAAMLTRLGISVSEAAGAEEALAAMEKAKPDAVLTDLWMSGINGAQLAAEVKNRFSDVAVFAITADPTLYDNSVFDLSKLDGIYVKPVSITILKEIIGKINH